MTRTTIRTARRLVRDHAAELQTEVDSETITVWFQNPCNPAAEKKAVKAICKELPAATTVQCGPKVIIYYRSVPVDQGNFNDRSSRWHY